MGHFIKSNNSVVCKSFFLQHTNTKKNPDKTLSFDLEKRTLHKPMLPYFSKVIFIDVYKFCISHKLP